MKTMKALVKSKPEPGLWLEEVPVPEIGMNDVLIKIQKTGICGTDVHIYNWDEWAQKTIPIPMPVGHEFVGTIVEIGSNVHDFKVGDLVSGEGHVVCPLPQLPGGKAASLQEHEWRWGQPSRSLCGIPLHPRNECLVL